MAEQTVLLVEDDTRLSEVVGSLLTLAGYRAVVIAEHALIPYAIETSHPGCVIMDGELNTSGQNQSWADAAAIRRVHPEIPVLMMPADSAALVDGLRLASVPAVGDEARDVDRWADLGPV